jgi:hypothetical protein
MEDQNEGTTLHLDSKKVEPIEVAAPQQPQKQIELTREKFLKIIKIMLENEEITRSQMLEMRRRFGITNASFHKKKVDKVKKKKAKKLARHHRRINKLNNSTKGQTKQQNRSK